MTANLTIQDIFEMRRNGQFEDAYQAILPMYKKNHGHYMTHTMFWTATDIMRLRIETGKVSEAEQIFASLRNIYPNLDDKDDTAAHALTRLAHQLITKEHEIMQQAEYKARYPEECKDMPDPEPMQFSILDYMLDFGNLHLCDEDWQATEWNGHPVPSFGSKIISRIFHEVKDETNPDRLNAALDEVLLGLQYNPTNKHLLRYQANLLYRLGQRQRAIAIYRQLCERSRESYIFSELSSMVDDKQEKAALLARAILNQRTEVFAQKDRIALAKLIAEYFPQNAAYELQMVIKLRDGLGMKLPSDVHEMARDLAKVTPVSDHDQREFYRKIIEG